MTFDPENLAELFSMALNPEKLIEGLFPVYMSIEIKAYKSKPDKDGKEWYVIMVRKSEKEDTKQ